MRREYTATIDIQPKLAFTEETYPNLNITPEYEDGKLTALRVDVEVILDDTADDDDIAEQTARENAIKTVIPLIGRLRYLKGMYLECMVKKLYRKSPPTRRAQLDTMRVTFRAKGVDTTSPMPNEDSLLEQDHDTTYQLMCYNRGMRADDVSEGIINFYLVLEREQYRF